GPAPAGLDPPFEPRTVSSPLEGPAPAGLDAPFEPRTIPSALEGPAPAGLDCPFGPRTPSCPPQVRQEPDPPGWLSAVSICSGFNEEQNSSANHSSLPGRARRAAGWLRSMTTGKGRKRSQAGVGSR